MNALDIGFATAAVLVAAILLMVSPWYRAVVKECLLHPWSNGWLEYVNGKVVVHRGQDLPSQSQNPSVATPQNRAGNIAENASR